MDANTVTQLLTGSGTGTSGTSGIDLSSLMSSLAPFILGSTVITIVIVILYAFSVISKYRANKAILDIKKLLIEMNERDKFQRQMATSDKPQTQPLPTTPPVPVPPTSISE